MGNLIITTGYIYPNYVAYLPIKLFKPRLEEVYKKKKSHREEYLISLSQTDPNLFERETLKFIVPDEEIAMEFYHHLINLSKCFYLRVCKLGNAIIFSTYRFVPDEILFYKSDTEYEKKEPIVMINGGKRDCFVDRNITEYDIKKLYEDK